MKLSFFIVLMFSFRVMGNDIAYPYCATGASIVVSFEDRLAPTWYCIGSTNVFKTALATGVVEKTLSASGYGASQPPAWASVAANVIACNKIRGGVPSWSTNFSVAFDVTLGATNSQGIVACVRTLDGSAQDEWHIRILAGNQVYINMWNTGYTTALTFYSDPLPLKRTSSAVITYSQSSGCRIYLNGLLNISTNKTASRVASPNNFTLLSDADGSTKFNGDGSIDNFSMYPYELTAAQVKAMYFKRVKP